MKTLLLFAILCMVAASAQPTFPMKVSIKHLARLWPRIPPIAHYAISARMPRIFGGIEGQLASLAEEDETDGGLVPGKRVAWRSKDKEKAYLYLYYVSEGVRQCFYMIL